MTFVFDKASNFAPVDKMYSQSGGPALNYKMVSSGATTNLTQIRTRRTMLHVITGANTNAAVRQLKLYDDNGLNGPVVGTTVPKMTITLPASAGFALDYKGLPFENGLAFALTTLAADNDATAVGAGDITGLEITYE